MPSLRRVVAYRPDDQEAALLEKMTRMSGLSMARLIGVALREKAKREGLFVSEEQASPRPDYSGIRIRRRCDMTETDRIEFDTRLEAAAQEAAPFYQADMALPSGERELALFETLNEVPVANH